MRILFIAVLLVGCGTQTANMKNVQLGMTVKEVVQIMGQPKATFVSPDAKDVVFAYCDTGMISDETRKGL